MSAEEWTLSRLKDNPVDALECIHALESEVAAMKSEGRMAEEAYAQMRTRTEAAEAKLAEAVRLLGSLFSVFGHSGLEPKYPSLTRQVSDLLASIDNDPAKRECSGDGPMPTGNRAGGSVPTAAANLGGVKTPSGVSPSPPDDIGFCTVCGRNHTPEDNAIHGMPVNRKPTRRPSADLDECGEGR